MPDLPSEFYVRHILRAAVAAFVFKIFFFIACEIFVVIILIRFHKIFETGEYGIHRLAFIVGDIHARVVDAHFVIARRIFDAHFGRVVGRVLIFRYDDARRLFVVAFIVSRCFGRKRSRFLGKDHDSCKEHAACEQDFFHNAVPP